MYRMLVFGVLVGALTILGTTRTAEAGHRGCGYGYSLGSYAVPIPSARYYRYPAYRGYYSRPYFGYNNYGCYPSFSIGLGFGSYGSHYGGGYYGGHYGGGHYGGGHYGGHYGGGHYGGGHYGGGHYGGGHYGGGHYGGGHYGGHH